MTISKILLKSNKGSALVMVVAVVLLLTSFGTITLLAGLSNTAMGAKYRNWTKEYYDVDKKTETYVARIDQDLDKAENYARQYFAQECYTNGTEDYSKLSIPGKEVFNESLQFSINEKWKGVKDSCYRDLDNPNLSESGKTRYLDQAVYQEALKDFVDAGFKKLYYYYAVKLLNSATTQNDFEKIEEPGGTANTEKRDKIKVVPELTAEEWDKLPVTLNTVGKTNDTFTVNIKARIKDSSNIDVYKMVDAALNITIPVYTMIAQTRMVPFKVNPIWTNAITAAGSIYFVDTSANTTAINGDLFSAARGIIENSGYIDEFQDYGIISGGSNVVVRGNIYSRGDVHVAGKVKNTDGTDKTYTKNNGRITVEKLNNEYKYKTAAFANKNLYLNMNDNRIGKYTQNDPEYIKLQHETPFMPLLYPDNDGGNVYCNSLTIEEGCKGAVINIAGNVTTRDDVQNDGQASNITVKGNFIGISSKSDAKGNFNASSSVLNNDPTSSIDLNGSFIIPGVAYLKTDDDKYYPTGISAGSLGTDGLIFNTFTYLGSNTLSEFTDFTIGGEKYSLFTGSPNKDPFEEKITRIKNYLQTNKINGDITNIKISQLPGNIVEGYALGTLITKTTTLGNSQLFDKDSIENYAANSEVYSYQNYEDFLLLRVLNAKTTSLGSDDPNKSVLLNLDGYINKSALNSLISENAIISGPTLELNDKSTSGIVYREGDLTITGNGEFKGTIICNGSVTITGNPKITYDEDVIVKLLNTYKDDFSKFFAPGQSDKEVFYDETSITSGYTKVKKRYSITQWKESQWDPVKDPD